jgi:hypothetical protein
METNDFFTNLTEQHPFITILTYAEQDYIGIVQNKDDSVTTLYDYGSITDTELRLKFLELGDVWWWESTREIPINLFLKSEWLIFKPYLKTFNNKCLTVIHGPIVSMTDFIKKRVKRKTVTLIRRFD